MPAHAPSKSMHRRGRATSRGGVALAVAASSLATSVLTAPSLLAQQPPVRDSAGARNIEAVQVRARRAPAIVGGASAQTLRTDSLRLDPSPTLADALRQMPLLLVRQNSRGELELSARGSESRQVGLLLEGLPLSAGWDGRADASLIPLSGVTQVTFVRGLGTVLAGPNTLGGTIDVSLVDPSAPLGTTSMLSVGSDQTGARLGSASVQQTRVSATGDRWQWQAGGGYRQRDGLIRAGDIVDVGGGTPTLRRNTDMEQWDAFARGAWQRRGGGTLSALVTTYDASRGVAPELHIQSPRLWRYPEQRRTAALLRAATDVFVNRLGTTQVEASLGVVDGRTRIAQYETDAYDVVAGREAGEERNASARALVRHGFASGAQLRAGATWQNTRYDELLGEDPAVRYEQRLASFGLEGDVPLGTRAILNAGVVRDAASTPRTGGRTSQPDLTSTGWRVGATGRATDALRVHASVSRRSRFPALRELYSGALNRFEVNPDLVPERLLATEAGITFAPDEHLGAFAQGTVFRHALDDGIVRITVPETRKFRRVNRDETRTVGLEGVLGWRSGPTRPSVMLDLVAQRVRVRDAINGGAADTPEHQPSLRALLDATFPLPHRVLVGATVQHLGSQYCLNPDLGAAQSLAAQTIGSLSAEKRWDVASWGAFRSLRALVGLDNVTDAAMYEQCGLPRAGRTLRVGIELR